MRIDLSARSLARAFALSISGCVAVSCSSQIAGLGDHSFASNDARAFSGEPTGSVPQGMVMPIRQPERRPVDESQARPQRPPAAPAARRPGTANAIESSRAANARPRVVLMRGLFGVFSTGLDSLAQELRGKGIDVEVTGHLSWSSAVADIVRERAAGRTGPLVLVGHSQGANNVIAVARALKAHNVQVDLLVTLAPFLPPPVPSNVVRAVNYYQFPGWGSPLTPDHGFDGRISNIDMAGDWTTFHITIDKSSKIHEEITREIAAL
jgi:hypothetical protein